MDTAPTFDEVVRALSALYREADPSGKEKASKWLNEMQNSVHAWQMADQLLQANLDLESSYFAAQTMRTKIQNSFNEVPPEAHQSLRDSLLRHCVNIKPETPNAIVTQFCLALADLVVQMASWKNPAVELIQQFGNNPQYWRFLVELLTVIPEEIDRKQLRLGDNRRGDIMEELFTSSQIFLQFISAVLASSPDDVNLQTKVYGCLGSWCQMNVVETQLLLSSNLLQNIFAALANKDCPLHLHQVAADCVCQAMFTNEDLEKGMNVATFIYDGVMSLVGPFEQATACNDTERASNYCRVFTELGEAVIENMLTQPNQGLGDFRILDLMINCLAHPNYEVADISMTFWDRLSDELFDLKKPEIGQLFLPYMQRLVLVLCQQCRYPASQQGLAAPRSDFEAFRKQNAEFIHFLDHLIPATDVMTRMLEIIQTPGTSWEMSEAALYLMTYIASYIPNDNETVVPAAVQMVLSISTEAHVCVRYTGLKLIGQLSKWLNLHQNYIEPMLKMLAAGIQHPGLMPIAVKSLCQLCTNCPSGLAPQFAGIVHTLQSLESNSAPLPVILELLTGLGALLSIMPAAQLSEGFQQLCYMQVEPLNKILELQGVPIVTGHRQSDPTVYLDRLSVIFRSTIVKTGQGVHPCQAVIEQIWPLLAKACEKYANDVTTIERVTRCIRYALRNLDQHAGSLFNPVLNQMVQLYRVRPHSCCLYIGSILLDIFSDQPTHVPLLVSMLETFSGPTFEILKDGGMVNHPDVVDDLFILGARFLRKAPVEFLQSPVARQLVLCAISGCSLQHREAHEQTMTFLESFVRTGLDNTDSLDFAVRHTLVSATVEELGQSIVTSALNAILFDIPKSCIKRCVTVIYALRELDEPTTMAWLQTALKSLPTQQPRGTVMATADQLQTFYDRLTDSQSLSTMSNRFLNFAELFR